MEQQVSKIVQKHLMNSSNENEDRTKAKTEDKQREIKSNFDSDRKYTNHSKRKR